MAWFRYSRPSFRAWLAACGLCVTSPARDRPACSRLYPNIRKNSSADLRGSRNKSDITATASAPAAMTSPQFCPGNASDRHQWLAGQCPGLAYARQGRSPDRDLPYSGGKHRTDGEVVCGRFVGLGELAGIVSGNAQPEIARQSPSVPPSGDKIVLSRHGRRRTPPPGRGRHGRSLSV